MPADDPQQLLLAFGRLEGKLDAVLAQLRRAIDDVEDHEKRLRDLESALHTLATREDIEAIEAKRQKKNAAILTWVLALVVPVEAAVITALLRALGG